MKWFVEKWKQWRNGQSWRKVSNIISVAILSGMLLLFLFAGSYSGELNRDLSERLIRFHVLANSDSPEDQALKLKVRDEIVTYMKELLKDSENVEQSGEIIRSGMENIKAVAADVIKKNGYQYPVSASFGSYAFPTRLYGDVALPAGNYNALRIVIGEGQGANWWCVLFPPLCFVDATHGTVPDDVKDELKGALTQEEYQLLTSAGSDEEIPVKIKFKVVEFFEGSKIKFTGLINQLFH